MSLIKEFGKKMYTPTLDIDLVRKLHQYAAIVAEKVFQEFPLSKKARRFLHELRRNLKLQDCYAQAVELQIFAQKAYLEVASREPGQLQTALYRLVLECINGVETGEQVPPRGERPPLWLWIALATAGVLTPVILTGLSYLVVPPPPGSPDATSTPSPENSLPPSPSVPLSPSPTPTASPSSAIAAPSPSPTSTVAEPVNKEAIRDRRRQLGIDFEFFTNLIDEVFYRQHPLLRHRKLQDGEADRHLQVEWNAIAQSLLDSLETLTPETRQRLGSYRRRDYDQWLQELGEGKLQKSPTLDPLADQRFFQLFPEMNGKPLNRRTFGQVWYAIAEEELKKMKTTSH
jgi:hypothetical protein